MTTKEYPLTNLEMLTAIIAEPGLEAENGSGVVYSVRHGKLYCSGDTRLAWPSADFRYRLLRPEPPEEIKLDKEVILRCNAVTKFNGVNDYFQMASAIIAQAVRMAKEEGEK